MKPKRQLIVLSHVLPFPLRSGQQQRVYYTLKAVRKFFETTFVSSVHQSKIKQTRNELLKHSDKVILLPSKYSRNIGSKVWHKIWGLFYRMKTGLKFSNYVINEVDFNPGRIASALQLKDYDCALFEYWHASDCIAIFHQGGVPCVLDMHDVLWRSYAKQLENSRLLPHYWKRRIVANYKALEEKAWKQFDAVIAINVEEQKTVRRVVCKGTPIFYAPMGVDLKKWQYSWNPRTPSRIVYYGGLNSTHNQRDARRCYQSIMPLIWKKRPEVELWIVGSHPPKSILSLSQKDKRVKVTGYLDQVKDVLMTMSVLICPWSGKYGFRSRIIEAMALGVPSVVTSDAVYGMGLKENRGLFIADTDEELSATCLNLLGNSRLIQRASKEARSQVEEIFGFEETYGKLARELNNFAQKSK